MTNICAKKINSALRNTTAQSLKCFTWAKLMTELDAQAPTFIRVLRGMIQVRRVRTAYHPSEEAILGVCASLEMFT